MAVMIGKERVVLDVGDIAMEFIAMRLANMSAMLASMDPDSFPAGKRPQAMREAIASLEMAEDITVLRKAAMRRLRKAVEENGDREWKFMLSALLLTTPSNKEWHALIEQAVKP